MKFTVSSSALSHHLQAIGKVISNKSTLPILDYFLFAVEGTTLTITGSDVETTLQATLEIENPESVNGTVAVPAKRIQESIKEFAEQPLTISVDQTSWEITIAWNSGKLSIPGITGVGYPELQKLNSGATSTTLSCGLLQNGISSSIFATDGNALRPVMNGVNIALGADNITFVATDSHRLVRIVSNGACSADASFILPTKPANLLRSILPRDQKSEVALEFDDKNAIFTMQGHKLICRLIEGNYPNYNAVIPKENENKLVVDRLELMASLRRVSVCSSQSSGLIRLSLSSKGLAITAQDLDFNTSAEDNIACEYNGETLDIGFKGPFLLDILSNIDTPEVMLMLGDQSKPGLFVPVNPSDEATSTLMLLMPMTINA